MIGESRRGGELDGGLLDAARRLLPWMVEIRRDLHRHPELGLEEFRTSARVQELLGEMAIDYRAGLSVTGVLGVLHGSGAAGPARPTKTVALRADLDALPLQDAKDVSYRSEIPGRMHACGHDVHTTVLLGAARLLRERQKTFAGTVKLLFQPAEETVGGAKQLIAEGALDDPPVDAIFGLHVDSAIDVGSVGLKYGQRNAASDDLEIVIHGRSSHGAYPSQGVDAIVAAAQVVTALQSVVSRNVDARSSAVITLGTIRGGAQANIVASRVEIVGTLRTLDSETREVARRRVREVSEGVAAALGARAEVRIEPSYDPVVNDREMLDLVRLTAGRLLGEEHVEILERPFMGVEDFGFYLTHVPGAFYSLGVRNRERGITHPVHNELFDVDEECLAYGAALQASIALTALGSSEGER